MPATGMAKGYWDSPVQINEVEPKDRICFAMYTVQGRTMKMMVQFYPLKKNESRQVYLEVEKNGKWQPIATGEIRENYYTKGSEFEAQAWNLLFRIDHWDHSKDFNYRVMALDGVAKYNGIIRKDPVDKEEIVVAAFTGNSRHDKATRMEMVDLVKKQNPDLLFFSGDQVYHHQHHLHEWLIFGSEFGELTRNTPAVSITDDHDVGQGNLWGANGKKSSRHGGADGGYLQTAQYVNEVQFAQTANLPDPFDPTPIEQGIGVYYTSLNIGGVDFAIIEDRKFKSAPLQIFPDSKGRRPDHPQGVKPEKLNSSKAAMLGKRQLKFLEVWGNDWRGVDMKCVLSQSIFCHGHTSQKMDLDTNGWPQHGRNKAIKAIRKSFSFMLAGDQHLATVIQHGVDEFGDAGYSFSVPSIVNHYPRVWKPKKKALRKVGPLPRGGDFLDGFHNKITMHRYANPDENVPPIVTRKKQTKQATGHGIVRFNKKTRKITMECWPRGADFKRGDSEQYPGWPMTVSQMDNYGRKAKAYLPTIKVTGMENPIVQLIAEASGETVYTLRIKGDTFRPKVFADGKYTLIVGDQGKNEKKLQGIVPSKTTSEIKVNF
ncbi:hypothetical protein HW115_05355 [Verrucomicrobiaceae bacterium N1E253]|uniref:PhoD-like phosphatase metallophosphatase domain-containing protein n=1 Tax=Oceaniferula marina TaxID=2748318 RepID=A0A851GIJ0_9BACT|nr:hypothetical protein [Oceaniferula marina]NWK55025.1 hypothetical protein [Oceaniferula marina]